MTSNAAQQAHGLPAQASGQEPAGGCRRCSIAQPPNLSKFLFRLYEVALTKGGNPSRAAVIEPFLCQRSSKCTFDVYLLSKQSIEQRLARFRIVLINVDLSTNPTALSKAGTVVHAIHTRRE